MICTRCHVLCRNVCPKCGSRKHLRAPEDNEPVLLIVLTAMQAMLVEPILEESGIPYYKQGMVGGALAAQVGMMREVYRFYVPIIACSTARFPSPPSSAAQSATPWPVAARWSS